MFNNNPRKTKTEDSPVTQMLAEIQRKEISNRLKVVERMIKDGNLDGARATLQNVKSLDPKNGYLPALEERIDELQKAREARQSHGLQETGVESSGIDETRSLDQGEYLDMVSDGIREVGERLEAEYRDKFTDGIREVEERLGAGYREEFTDGIRQIGERLESEYRDKISEEIDKSERRVTESLNEERGSLDAQLAALIEKFGREKDEFLGELKKEAKKIIEAEFKKADDSYRKLLEDKMKKMEDKNRGELREKYDRKIAQLKQDMSAENDRMLEAERRTLVEDTRKKTEDELKTRILEWLGREKAETPPSHADDPKEPKAKPAKEVDFKREVETGSVVEHPRIHPAEARKPVEEKHKAPAAHVTVEPPPQEKEPEPVVEIENRPPETPEQLATRLGIKSDEQFAREREEIYKMLESDFNDIRSGVKWEERPKKKKG